MALGTESVSTSSFSPKSAYIVVSRTTAAPLLEKIDPVNTELKWIYDYIIYPFLSIHDIMHWLFNKLRNWDVVLNTMNLVLRSFTESALPCAKECRVSKWHWKPSRDSVMSAISSVYNKIGIQLPANWTPLTVQWYILFTLCWRWDSSLMDWCL